VTIDLHYAAAAAEEEAEITALAETERDTFFDKLRAKPQRPSTAVIPGLTRDPPSFRAARQADPGSRPG
jgi:hypothetical protein